MSRSLIAALSGLISLAIAAPVYACDQCACPFRSKASTAGGPTIVTPNASTMGRGRGSIGFLFEHQRYNTIPADDAEQFHHQGNDVHGKNHEEIYQVAAGYGLTKDLDLYVALPLVFRSSHNIEDDDALGADERSEGVGDLRVMAKYRVWDEGVDASLLAGVKAPTGETSDRNRSGEKFEAEMQPGSGAWDVTLGMAASRRLVGRLSLASAFQYTYRGEGAQDEKLGNVMRSDLGLSFGLTPVGRYPNVSAVLELQHQYAFRDRARDDRKVLASGGTTVLLSPGVSAALSESLEMYAAMPIPVYQNLGGEHEELKYEVISGMAVHF